MKISFNLFVPIFLFSFNLFSQDSSIYSKHVIGVYVSTVDNKMEDFYDPSFIGASTLGTTKEQNWAISLNYKYLLKYNCYARILIGWNRYHINYGEQTIMNIKFRGTSDQNTFFFNPGVERHIQIKKLDFFGGFEIPFKIYDAYISNITQDYFDPNNYNFIGTAKNNIHVKGGYSIGIAPISGFNYFLNNHLSIGGELSLPLTFVSLGGQISQKGNDVYNSPTGNTSSYRKAQSIKVSPLVASITFNYWFGRK